MVPFILAIEPMRSKLTFVGMGEEAKMPSFQYRVHSVTNTPPYTAVYVRLLCCVKYCD